MAFGRGGKGDSSEGAGARPQSAGRVAMAQRIREDRDPKLRDQSGFEDAAGPERRRNMDRSLAIVGALNTESMKKTLEADQAFARVEQLRGGHALLVSLGVTKGSNIKGMGERLHGPTLSEVRPKDVAMVRIALRQANPRAPVELIQAVCAHASDAPRALLSNAAFVELVIARNKGAELLSHMKAAAWRPGLELLKADAKIAEFLTKNGS